MYYYDWYDLKYWSKQCRASFESLIHFESQEDDKCNFLLFHEKATYSYNIKQLSSIPIVLRHTLFSTYIALFFLYGKCQYFCIAFYYRLERYMA